MWRFKLCSRWNRNEHSVIGHSNRLMPMCIVSMCARRCSLLGYDFGQKSHWKVLCTTLSRTGFFVFLVAFFLIFGGDSPLLFVESISMSNSESVSDSLADDSLMSTSESGSSSTVRSSVIGWSFADRKSCEPLGAMFTRTEISSYSASGSFFIETILESIEWHEIFSMSSRFFFADDRRSLSQFLSCTAGDLCAATLPVEIEQSFLQN